MTPEFQTPEDDRPAPARNERGQWLPGETGNPGGLPNSARDFRRKARFYANEALTRLVESLATLEGRDLIAATKLLAEHGGYITPEAEARLVLDGRRILQGEGEWDKFAGRLISITDGADQPAIEAPAEDDEETLP